MDSSYMAMTNGMCDTCSRWFCTADHDLDGTGASRQTRIRVAQIYRRNPDKKKAQVAKWQRENKEKVNAKQRRYYERLRQERSNAAESAPGDK